MKSGAVFKSNTSQAIRLPKDVALPESVKRVDIFTQRGFNSEVRQMNNP